MSDLYVLGSEIGSQDPFVDPHADHLLCGFCSDGDGDDDSPDECQRDDLDGDYEPDDDEWRREVKA